MHGVHKTNKWQCKPGKEGHHANVTPYSRRTKHKEDFVSNTNFKLNN